MPNDLSIFHLIINASFVVQLVMALLLIASIFSWAFIFIKRAELAAALQASNKFKKKLNNIDIAIVYRQLCSTRKRLLGIENLFMAGYSQFKQQQNQDLDNKTKQEQIQRVMRITLSRELDKLNKALFFLATAGSTSPYVGLFGTVWGIMNSFRALGEVKQATLAHVAPGIAEALIATAMGLFVAIPAVIAYNHFSTQLGRIAESYEVFIDEFIVLLARKND